MGKAISPETQNIMREKAQHVANDLMDGFSWQEQNEFIESLKAIFTADRELRLTQLLEASKDMREGLESLK